jgi:cytochrome c553
MKTWSRRIGYGIVALLAVLLICVGVIYLRSTSRMANVEGTPHALDASEANAAEGQRLANAFGCTGCHGGNFGGTLLIDGLPFARLPAPNLTAGAPGGAASDEQWEIAVRHGIGFDGRPLFIMPSRAYSRLSDAHVSSIIAWARTLPAVQNPLPGRQFGPIGRMVIALGQLPPENARIAKDVQHLQTKPAPTAEFGYYLTRLCQDCHGEDLHGGPAGQREPAPGPDLSPAGRLGSWSMEQFVTALREGRRPDGTMLNDTTMPWQALANLNDIEMSALWAYLSTMPAT